MGYSRQDYGDYGAASLGNSCYKTHRERATLPVRWESISAINTFIAVFANVNVIARCTGGTITVKQTTQSLIGW